MLKFFRYVTSASLLVFTLAACETITERDCNEATQQMEAGLNLRLKADLDYQDIKQQAINANRRDCLPASDPPVISGNFIYQRIPFAKSDE